MLPYNRNTPILFLIFNRPSTTARVFSQIQKMKPSKFYIAADGPRDHKEKEICEQVRDMVVAIDWECDVFKIFRDENLGCAKAISEAISWFFELEPEGIILEDDCLPSDSFFGFCSAMLERYRDDERIGHINGSNYQNGIIRGDGSYYFSTLTHVWGWAGWRRVWKDYQLRPASFIQFEKMRRIEQMPAHAPFKDIWLHNFRVHCVGTASSWDYQYSYLNLINHRLTVIPNTNLISNIGCSDNPTHFIQDHPLADVPLCEMEEIVHPSFFIADIEADMFTQYKEYRIKPSNANNHSSTTNDRMQRFVTGKESGLEIIPMMSQFYF